MTEKKQETLSALFDDESSEFETRRLLQELNDDDLAQWTRHQMLRDTLSGELNTELLSINIADKVAAAIADEDQLVGVQPVSTPKPATNNTWLKPVVGFAAAASFAFVAVLGVQQQSATPQGFVANGNVSASQLQISGGVGLNQVSGVSTVNNAQLEKEMHRIELEKQQQQEKLESYMEQHSQHSVFNNGQGLIPVARISNK